MAFWRNDITSRSDQTAFGVCASIAGQGNVTGQGNVIGESDSIGAGRAGLCRVDGLKSDTGFSPYRHRRSLQASLKTGTPCRNCDTFARTPLTPHTAPNLVRTLGYSIEVSGRYAGVWEAGSQMPLVIEQVAA